MTISVNAVTHIILVPQSYLTLVSAGLYELNTDIFRKDLRTWEASTEGRTELRTHDHNTEYTVAGVTYARKIEIINGYKVEFEDIGSLYAIRLSGSNNNIFDLASGVLVPTNVVVIPGNAAGLQTVVSGSGVTNQDKLDIAQQVWSHIQ